MYLFARHYYDNDDEMALTVRTTFVFISRAYPVCYFKDRVTIRSGLSHLFSAEYCNTTLGRTKVNLLRCVFMLLFFVFRSRTPSEVKHGLLDSVLDSPRQETPVESKAQEGNRIGDRTNCGAPEFGDGTGFNTTLGLVKIGANGNVIAGS